MRATLAVTIVGLILAALVGLAVPRVTEPTFELSSSELGAAADQGPVPALGPVGYQPVQITDRGLIVDCDHPLVWCDDEGA